MDNTGAEEQEKAAVVASTGAEAQKKALVRKVPWTVAEDKILKEYVEKNGANRWDQVAKNSGLGRDGKSCRLRWMNVLRPGLKKKEPFSREEDEMIVQLQSQHSNQWSRMTEFLPGRTDNDIKNYWNSKIKRKKKKMVLPENHINDHLQLPVIQVATLSNPHFTESAPQPGFSDSLQRHQDLHLMSVRNPPPDTYFNSLLPQVGNPQPNSFFNYVATPVVFSHAQQSTANWTPNSIATPIVSNPPVASTIFDSSHVLSTTFDASADWLEISELISPLPPYESTSHGSPMTVTDCCSEQTEQCQLLERQLLMQDPCEFSEAQPFLNEGHAIDNFLLKQYGDDEVSDHEMVMENDHSSDMVPSHMTSVPAESLAPSVSPVVQYNNNDGSTEFFDGPSHSEEDIRRQTLQYMATMPLPSPRTPPPPEYNHDILWSSAYWENISLPEL